MPGVAFGSWVDSIANAANTYDQITNKYFYASVGLLMITLPALGRIRRGGQMRPAMAKAVAGLIHTVNFVCLTFLVIHFAPETSSILDWFLDVFGRIF